MGTPTTVYDSLLSVQLATTPRDLRDAQALRYRVYCIERGFEQSADFPNRLERDEFDLHALHLLVRYQPAGQAVGVTRLVLDGERESNQLPIEGHQSPSVARNLARVRSQPGSKLAEISRLAVTRQLAAIRAGDAPSTPMSGGRVGHLNSTHVSVGLLAQALVASWEQGITHWTALLDSGLLRFLSRLGIHCQPIGTVIEHRGPRQPVMASVADLWAGVSSRRGPLFELASSLNRSFPQALPSQDAAMDHVARHRQ